MMRRLLGDAGDAADRGPTQVLMRAVDGQPHGKGQPLLHPQHLADEHLGPRRVESFRRCLNSDQEALERDVDLWKRNR